jgi:AraC-like DNA-binding protein
MTDRGWEPIMTRLPADGREVTVSCAALLAVQPVTREDEQRATQALRSLVADGWTIKQLADTTGLTVRAIGRTINVHTTPAPGSTTAIIDALDQLRFEDPADGAASMRARYRGEHAGWDPVKPARAYLDDLAVDRVANDGKDVSLRPAEQHAALQRLAGQYPDIEIGRRLGMSARTVLRHRASQGLPACRPVPAKAPPDDHRLRPPPRASITPG